MSRPSLIGVDWGTSNFRAFALDASGQVLDRRAGPHGIMAVKDFRFGEVLSNEIGEWISGVRVPVLMSGMIGSRQGWVEAVYVETPAGVDDLVRAFAPVPFEATDVRIVPGLKTSDGGAHDVIRGEETQVFGALSRLGREDGRFLLPGTHSKWVRVEAGRVTRFQTYMTGEIYSAAREHTILGRLMQAGEGSADAFTRGVGDGARSGGPGALLHRLFAVRTAGLFGDIPGPHLADYLSGLLIGAEIADQRSEDKSPVIIIASDALAARYETAAVALGLPAEALASECIVDGYFAMARMARLI